MKKLLVFLISVGFLTSCNKLDQDNPMPVNPEIQISRQNEVLPDPMEIKMKTPLQFSEKLLREGRTVAFTKSGKKYHDGSHEALRLEFQSQARGTKGNGWGQGGSQGGTTTGGGGTTTTTGDVTPPRISISSPTAGQILNLGNGGLSWCNWGFFVDDDYKLTRVLVKIKGELILDTTGVLDADGSNGIWTVFQGVYSFPFGDGGYDMVVQAWDSTGNTNISTVIFSRNTQTATPTVSLPSSWILPTPRNPYSYQGGEGSCAAFAAANAYTIQRYVKEGQTGGYNSNNVYSPEWVYNIAVGGRSCGGGSGIMSNMWIIQGRGIPTWNSLPYDYNNGCDTAIFTDAIRANATANKIVTGVVTATMADIELIKQNIYQGKPGTFGFAMDRNFVNGTPDYIWTFPHYQDYYLHGCVIVGYDDSKHAFLILNSWGDSWAGNNCRWIDYDFFWQCVSYSANFFTM